MADGPISLFRRIEECILEHTLQLLDIAWPVIVAQNLVGLRQDLLRFHLMLLSQLADNMFSQLRDILAPTAQCGYTNHALGDTLIEISGK